MNLYAAFAELHSPKAPWGSPVKEILARRIVARDENDVRRILAERFKEQGYIARTPVVTLVQQNVTATREQEREILNTVKAFIADLGPESVTAPGLKAGIEAAEKALTHQLCLDELARHERAAEERWMKERLRYAEECDAIRRAMKNK